MKRAAGFDPDFGTATQALAALRRGAISSRELTSHVFARIKKHNPALNCFVTLTEDQAMARAAEADAALAKKKPCGWLHGLPIVVTAEGPRPYGEMSKWISFAALTGCPATVAPVGRTTSGLPVGIQIMGPYLEDATPIDIATKLAAIMGGFVPPPALGAGKS